MKDIKETLDKHEKWSNGGGGGERAHLEGAHLERANTSGCFIIPTASSYIAKHFISDGLRIIVYKTFGLHYQPVAGWTIHRNAVIEETPNPSRCTACGSGINVATLRWINQASQNLDIWKCRIRWIDLADTVVPFGSDGKIRCARLELIEKVDSKGKPKS